MLWGCVAVNGKENNACLDGRINSRKIHKDNVKVRKFIFHSKFI